MKKMGRRHANSFRIVVTDVRSTRDGAVIERIGTYIPDWLGVGAQPTETVVSLLKKAGISTSVAGQVKSEAATK